MCFWRAAWVTRMRWLAHPAYVACANPALPSSTASLRSRMGGLYAAPRQNFTLFRIPNHLGILCKITAKVSHERFAILYEANYEGGTGAMGCFNHLIWRVSRRSARWTAAQPCQAIASNLQRRPHRAVVERLVNGFAQRLLECDAKVFYRPKDARTEIDKRAIQI